MADTIKQRIALDGDDAIKKSLANIGEVGEASGKKIEAAMKQASAASKEAADKIQALSARGAQAASGGGGSGGGGSAIESAAKRAGTSVEEFQARTDRFKASLAQLAPAAAVAGGGIGNLATAFGLLGRVIGAAGGIGAVVAAVAAGGVKLAKAAEDVERAKRRLAASGGSGQASAGLNAEAEKLGTDAASQQPALEKFLQYRRKLQAENIPLREPMSPDDPRAAWAQGQLGLPQIPSEKTFLGAQGALSAAIRSDVKDPKAAAQLQHSFFSDLLDKGKLTPDNVTRLETASPTGANALSKALAGAPFSSGGHAGNFTNPEQLLKSLSLGNEFDVRGVLGGLDKSAPQIRSDADSARGVTQAFEALGAAAGRLTEKFGGDPLGIANKVDTTARAVDRVGDAVGPVPQPLDALRGAAELLKGITDDLKSKPITESGPRSEAAPVSAQQPQQFAGLSETIQQAFQSFLGSVTKQPDLKQDGIPPAGGIRGDNADQMVQAVQAVAALGQVSDTTRDQVAALAEALGGAVAQIRGGDAQPVAHAAGGGHIRGAGTPTSDSIPAMLSDGEYVVKADAVKRLGVDKLDAINSGGAHFADGGKVANVLAPGKHNITYDFDTGGVLIDGVEHWPGDPILDSPSVQSEIERSKKEQKQNPILDGGPPTTTETPPDPSLRGNLSVTYDPNTGGAYVNGNLHVPGDPLLNVPFIKAAIDRSKADMGKAGDGSTKSAHKSDFVGLFGGHEFDTEGSYASGGLVGNAPLKLAGGGSVSPKFAAVASRFNDHLTNAFPAFFADGGIAGRLATAAGDYGARLSESMPDISAPSISLNTAIGSDMPHLGSVDLRTDHGDFKMMAPADVAKQMARAARDSAAARTGKMPSWYR